MGTARDTRESLVGVTYEVINAAVSCEPASRTGTASFLSICPKLRFLGTTYAGPLASLIGNLPLVILMRAFYQYNRRDNFILSPRYISRAHDLC